MTKKDVEELIDMVDSGKYYLYEIAEWFGISYSYVMKIYERYKK